MAPADWPVTVDSHRPPDWRIRGWALEDCLLRSVSLRPSLFPIVVSAAALLAFRGQPREVGDVSAHPRFRTVDEETGLKAFIGVKVEASL